MVLASETKKGETYILKEKILAEHIAREFNAEAVELGNATTNVDRLFIRDSKVVSVVEIKHREMSLADLMKFGTYLISYDKITNGVAISELLHVPFFVFVYLVHSGDLVYFKISDETGRDICDYVVERSETKADCNGGNAVRENAYLYLDKMIVMSTPKDG